MKKFAIATILILAMVGLAAAAHLPPSTPETENSIVTRYVECDGSMFESVDMVIGASNVGTPLEAPLSTGEVMSAGVYTRDVLARGTGIVSSSVTYGNTKNVGSSNPANIVSDFDFEIASGRAYIGETAAILSIGDLTKLTTTTTSGTASICPFDPKPTTTTTTTYIPPFCNRIVMDADYDISSGTISTNTGLVTIAGTTNVPVGFVYDVDASGNGLASIRLDVLALDGRRTDKLWQCCMKPAPSVITDYEDSILVDGKFDLNQIISYHSGLNL